MHSGYTNPVAFSLDDAKPEEMEWYGRLASHLGAGYTPHKALNYHWVMYHGRTVPKSIRQTDFFWNHSPAARKILLTLMEKVIEGEHLPDF